MMGLYRDNGKENGNYDNIWLKDCRDSQVYGGYREPWRGE